MKNLFLVALGGGLGAVARYKIGGWIFHFAPSWKFPLGTFLVNLTGCLIGGILAGLVRSYDFFHPSTRLFLFTGLLGGFTTFSAFGFETAYLIHNHETALAMANIVLSVLAGVFVFWFFLEAI